MLTVSSRFSTWPRICTTVSTASSGAAASYTLPKNMHWMELSRSSTVTMAHGLPFFDTRRSTFVIRPAIVTCWPSGMLPARSIRCAIDISRNDTRIDCMPLNGWSDTYRPSISRSKLSLVFLSHSSTSGTCTMASPMAESFSLESSRSANRSNWPSACLRFRPTTELMAVSWMVNSARRFGSIESNAPALISDSTNRLFSASNGTRLMKSVKFTYLSWPFSRSAMIASTAFLPTLRMAPRPNRTTSPTAEYSYTDSFTSGESTWMPMRRASPRYSAVLSLFVLAPCSRAAMNSTG